MSQRIDHDDDDDDGIVYVAVGRNFEENKLSLIWTLENFPRMKICILHIHQPGKLIPLGGRDFPISKLQQHEIRDVQQLERNVVRKILDDYLLICQQSEVQAEKLCIELDDIGQGIVELIYQHKIKKLVMGAAANRYYSEEMMEVRSKKAMYVQRRMPVYCQIWFICKGYLICTGEGEFRCSYTEVFGASSSAGNGGLESHEVEQQGDDNEQYNIDELCTQLEHAMLETERFRQEAFEESKRRREAERTATKCVCKAKALESLYRKELMQRKETEEALSKEKEEHRRTKNQREEERLVAMDQQLLLQIEVSNHNTKIAQLDNEKISAIEQCIEYKRELDKLQEELDNASKSSEEISRILAETASATHLHQFLLVFSLSEIEEATHNFNQSLKIGESRYGSIYKGFLRHTPVAIKVLNQNDMIATLEFEHEVNVLQKLRHPHLISLIGTCSEACIMIYEHLLNGSLEDRLRCKDNTAPLPWQTRIRIATELCSTLIFLHSSTSDRIVHGHLTPRIVLLDGNFTCKISEFGICRTISPESSNSMRFRDRNDDAFLYVDPHFHVTGELSPKSDTYSFGIILLQLLSGRLSASDIVKEIGDQVGAGNLDSVLDPLAGDWPFPQAKQLAQLALKCCSMNQSRRPDLASEVWRMLEPMRAFCGSPGTSVSSPQEHQQVQPPSHFLCPIMQEVMQDPQVAADGFTYEREALMGWIESEHNTSPMTNLPLPHFNLVPNRSLRSAIQEWLERNPDNHFT